MKNRNATCKKFDYIHLIPILYCISIIVATFMRWMQYVNFLTVGCILFYILREKEIKKSILCGAWTIYIFLYPLMDCALRNKKGLSFDMALCYLVPIGILLFGRLNTKDIQTLFIFIKGFALFQAFGIYLSKLVPSLYVAVTWRVLGAWYETVCGFASDPTVTTNIIVMGIGVYATDLWVNPKKNKRINFSCLLLLLFAMIIAGKRSFLIAMGIAFILVFAAESIFNRKKLAIVIISLPSILLAGIGSSLIWYKIFGANNALGRMGATFIGISSGEDVSSMRSTWAEYMRQWRSGHEVFGIGWENFQTKIMETPYGGRVPNGHCVYKQILCETGYIGVSIFILLVVVTIILAVKKILFYKKIRDKQKLAFAMISTYMVIVFIVYAYFGNSIYDAFIYLYFFAAVSIVGTLRNSAKLFMKQIVI